MREGNSTMNAIMRHIAVVVFACLHSTSAFAASIQIPDLDPFTSFLTFAAVAVFIWAFLVVRKLGRDENKARQRVSELEIKLKEAEAAFAAEAHVMIVWHGKQDMPSRIIGSMYGSAKVPMAAADMLNLPAWLEADSSNVIEDCIRTLREIGKPFNIGVKTLHNELLEADGRAAGGMATLRFRPLSGERQQIT